MFSAEYDDQGTVRLIGEASAREAEQLKATLLLAVGEQRKAWTLDLSRLESLDTCTAQLLLSFKRSVPAFRAHSCKREVREFLESTGLSEQLL